MRRLAGNLGPAARLRACYEAGPCGFELHRLLTSMGIARGKPAAVAVTAMARELAGFVRAEMTS